MDRREPPPTAEGWYALHDLRSIDWAAWQDAPERVRQRAVEEATAFLADATAVEDAAAGDSAHYAVTGHEADLMVVHLRPTHAAVEHLERRFERTELAGFTERSASYVSVTEASGYSERAREFFDGEVGEDSGLARYMRSRLYPEIPDSEHVSFYPMEKRRDGDANWYDLPFEERVEHMDSHGDIGRDYAGQVEQMITASTGLDDWEWGVTLWADDLTDVKDLLVEMRFDPSSSKFAEFGPFYVGRRFPPADLDAYLAGEQVPTDGDGSATPADEAVTARSTSEAPTPDASDVTTTVGAPGDEATATAAADGDGTANDSDGMASEGGDTAPGEDDDGTALDDDATASADDDASTDGRPPTPGDAAVAESVDDVDRHLARFGVMPSDYAEGDHGLVFYAEADAEDLVEAVTGLRENFDHYDTHVLTGVRADQGQTAVVSVWETESAATTAAGFLSDVDTVTRGVRGPLGDAPADRAAGGTGAADSAIAAGGTGSADGPAAEGPAANGSAADSDDPGASVRAELADNDVYAGKPHGEDVYALVVYSDADPETLDDRVDDLREGFDRYDTHVKTAVYEASADRRAGGADGDDEAADGAGEAANVAAVVTLWETEDAANTASEYLSGLPGIVGRPADRDGFGTMGMFYTVKPDYREEFVDTFGAVGGKLEGMDGHRETALLVNREDETDMFIASRWDAREDAMAFFRSEDFRDTVEWGREVLADRPRHVFLA